MSACFVKIAFRRPRNLGKHRSCAYGILEVAKVSFPGPREQFAMLQNVIQKHGEMLIQMRVRGAIFAFRRPRNLTSFRKRKEPAGPTILQNARWEPQNLCTSCGSDPQDDAGGAAPTPRTAAGADPQAEGAERHASDPQGVHFQPDHPQNDPQYGLRGRYRLPVPHHQLYVHPVRE